MGPEKFRHRSGSHRGLRFCFGFYRARRKDLIPCHFHESMAQLARLGIRKRGLGTVVGCRDGCHGCTVSVCHGASDTDVDPSHGYFTGASAS